jgi:hypothetical protein
VRHTRSTRPTAGSPTTTRASVWQTPLARKLPEKKKKVTRRGIRSTRVPPGCRSKRKQRACASEWPARRGNKTAAASPRASFRDPKTWSSSPADTASLCIYLFSLDNPHGRPPPPNGNQSRSISSPSALCSLSKHQRNSRRRVSPRSKTKRNSRRARQNGRWGSWSSRAVDLGCAGRGGGVGEEGGETRRREGVDPVQRRRRWRGRWAGRRGAGRGSLPHAAAPARRDQGRGQEGLPAPDAHGALPSNFRFRHTLFPLLPSTEY